MGTEADFPAGGGRLHRGLGCKLHAESACCAANEGNEDEKDQ